MLWSYLIQFVVGTREVLGSCLVCGKEKLEVLYQVIVYIVTNWEAATREYLKLDGGLVLLDIALCRDSIGIGGDGGASRTSLYH